MNLQQLTQELARKKSYLCTGLDTDISKLPAGIKKDVGGALAFNKSIIEATEPFSIAYKINTAFYESLGLEGWHLLEETIKSIPPHCLIIADAKRGDIGNTADQYARAFFEKLGAHAITVSPYMGLDTLEPFLAWKNHFTIVLGLTSNPGSQDFEMLNTPEGPVYQVVMKKVAAMAGPEQLMFVTGATQATQLQNIRQWLPKHWLLVPGVGAQGGDLEAISQAALHDQGGLLVNASRSIIYASNHDDYAQKAAEEASRMQKQMETFLEGIFKYPALTA